MQAAQGPSAVFKGHTADKWAVGQEGDVHGREGQESVHDVRSGSSNAQEAKEEMSVVLFAY